MVQTSSSSSPAAASCCSFSLWTLKLPINIILVPGLLTVSRVLSRYCIRLRSLPGHEPGLYTEQTII